MNWLIMIYLFNVIFNGFVVFVICGLFLILMYCEMVCLLNVVLYVEVEIDELFIEGMSVNFLC